MFNISFINRGWLKNVFDWYKYSMLRYSWCVCCGLHYTFLDCSGTKLFELVKDISFDGFVANGGFVSVFH